MRCGQQRCVPALTTNTDFALYGALNPLTGEMLHARFDRMISQHTTTFLQQIADAHPNGSMTIIWDRASFHTSRHVEQWLENHPRFEVILLPPRSPQMNPVEDIWRHLKNQVAANLTSLMHWLRPAIAFSINIPRMISSAWLVCPVLHKREASACSFQCGSDESRPPGSTRAHHAPDRAAAVDGNDGRYDAPSCGLSGRQDRGLYEDVSAFDSGAGR